VSFLDIMFAVANELQPRECHAGLMRDIGGGNFRLAKRSEDSTAEWAKLLGVTADNSYRQSDDSWPLAMDPSSQMVVDSYVQSSFAKAHIVSEVIIGGAVKEIGMIYSSASALTNCVESVPKDETLLSLDGARFLLVSFSKLEDQAQKGALRRMLAPLEIFFAQNIEAERFDEPVFLFIARTLTLCFSAYTVNRFGTEARKFVDGFGISSPRLAEIIELTKTKSSYRGLFDPANFRLPCWDPDSMIQDDLDISCSLQNVLEAAFKISVSDIGSAGKSALSFAAYGALGQSIMWRPPPSAIEAKVSLLESDLHLLVLELRADVCLLHTKFKKCQRLSHDGLTIERLAFKKVSKTSLEDVRKDLQSLLLKATGIIHGLLESSLVMQPVISSVVFVVLETALSCLTFTVSCFTKTSKPCLDIGRNRLISIESEAAMSDEYSDGSVEHISGGSQHLQEIINSIGSAPCHPDWLDGSCILAGNFTHEESVESARDALKIFCQALETVRVQIRRTQQRLIKECNHDLTDDEAYLITELLALRERSGHRAVENSVVDLRRSLSLAFRCSESFIEALSIRSLTIRPAEETPILGCSHQIMGLDIDDIDVTSLPQLRATGKWESMLLLGLASVLGDVDFEDEIPSSLRGELLQLYRWSGLQERALSNVIPITALFRFGLAKGGRGQHPLIDCDLPTGMYNMHFLTSGDGRDGFPVIHENVANRPGLSQKVLGIVAELPLTDVSQSIAHQLVRERNEFLRFHGTTSMAANFKILLALNAHKRQIDNTCFSKLMDQVARLVVAGSNDEIPLKMLTVLGAAVPTGLVVVDQGNVPYFQESAFSESSDRIVQYLVDEISGKAYCHSEEREDIATSLLSTVLNFERNRSEKSSVVLDMVVKAFVALDPEDLANIARNRMLCTAVDSNGVGANVTAILAHLVSSNSHYDVTAGMAKRLLVIIQGNFDQLFVYSREIQESIVCVALLCALRCDMLFELGSLLISNAGPSNGNGNDPMCNRNEHIQYFCSFVAGVAVLQRGDAAMSKDQNGNAMKERIENFGAGLPESCTYASDNDFRDQHWYNCGTCGLVGDAGCCSLCAVACHQGHELWYARYGSFMCDCGEMTANSAKKQEPPIRCRCLVPQLRDKHASTSVLQAWSTPAKTSPQSCAVNVTMALSLLDFTRSEHSHAVQKAFKVFIAKAQASSWCRSILERACSALLEWQDDKHSEADESFLPSEDTKLSLHEGPPLLTLVQASTYGVPTEDALSRSHIMKLLSAPQTTILAANCRGYLAISEDSCLTFYSCPSMLTHSTSSPILLGKVPTVMTIAGMLFSPHNDQRLLFWGPNGAKIGLVDDSWQSLKKIVRLGVGEDMDNVIGCTWIRDECHVLVWSRQCIYLFFVQPEDDSVVVYSKVVLSALLKDLVILPSCSDDGHSVLVLHDGGIISRHSLCNDENGQIVVNSTSAEIPDEISESRTVAYLQEGSILLWEASDSGIFAQFLGSDLEFGPYTTILPPKVDVLGKEKRLGAPYSKIRHLGVTKDTQGRTFHSICCYATKWAKKERSSVLLIVHFNKDSIYIEETNCDFPEDAATGLAIFSYPEMEKGFEHVILAAASHGTIKLYAGSSGMPILCRTTTSIAQQRMSKTYVCTDSVRNLLAFEGMRNATNSPSIILRCSCSVL
jgi:Putative zinc finger in N-recognin (UBR box)